MSQPALFTDPVWSDHYAPGDLVTDGIRTGRVTAVVDCAGGVDRRCLVVDCDGHVITYGYDHRLATIASGSHAHAAGARPGAGRRRETDVLPADESANQGEQ